MADSEAQSTVTFCPDTGQAISETSEETEVSSATGDCNSLSTSSEPNSFQPVKAAKFVPTNSGDSNSSSSEPKPFQPLKTAKFVPTNSATNPFAARPTLKTDVVSTSSTTGVPSAAKLILRPSSLAAHPQNNRTAVSSANTASVTSLLKPAKLPDPTKSLEKDIDGLEKENEELGLPTPSHIEETDRPDEHADDNLFQSTFNDEEARKKLPDSSSSPEVDAGNSSSTEQTDNILGENLTEKVTGVHTSPKGHVSSSGFVFGENLAERVEFKADKDGTEPEGNNGESVPDSTNSAAAEKTLEESAREYQLTHGKKTELQEVEVVTGEENESNVIQTNGKLFVFDADAQNWIEKGRGLFRLNDMSCESSQTFQSRLLMRTQGSLRLILNTKIWAGMNVERASQKSVRITGTDGDVVKVFLIMTNPKDTENLLRALDWRVQQLQVKEDKCKELGVTEKRKADVDSPFSEETVVKKMKKSVKEECLVRNREESDSSVIDPETEVSSESQASSFTLRTDSD